MINVDIKVVLLGATAVGKSCLSHRISNDKFNSALMHTIGTAFVSKQMIVDGKKLVLGIWDTAGCERYNALTKMYYRGAQAAVICYDVTNAKTFDRAKSWIQEVRSFEENCRIYICATKSDLLSAGKQASPDLETVENYAAGVQCRFYVTSNVTGENVAELFQDIANYYAPLINKDSVREWGADGFVRLTIDNKTKSCCPLGRR